MKYMLIMRANDEGYAAFDEMDFTEVIAAMGAYNESLIKAGAFDSFGATRRALLEIHEDAAEAAVDTKRKEATGAIGFDFDSLYDDIQEIAPAKVPAG